MDAAQAAWLREICTWLASQVRLLGYSPSFREALAELISTARKKGVPVRQLPNAFGGQEGEEALYEFAERLQGLLELADRQAPDIAGDLEEAVRNGLADKPRTRPRERVVATRSAGSRIEEGTVPKSEAAGAGRDVARKNKSELLVHGRDGKIRERSTFGNDPRRRSRRSR
jgi:sugar/nucleoside kinase (ribokinase family)